MVQEIYYHVVKLYLNVLLEEKKWLVQWKKR